MLSPEDWPELDREPGARPSGTVRSWLYRSPGFPEPDALGEYYPQNGEGSWIAEHNWHFPAKGQQASHRLRYDSYRGFFGKWISKLQNLWNKQFFGWASHDEFFRQRFEFHL